MLALTCKKVITILFFVNRLFSRILVRAEASAEPVAFGRGRTASIGLDIQYVGKIRFKVFLAENKHPRMSEMLQASPCGISVRPTTRKKK